MKVLENIVLSEGISIPSLTLIFSPFSICGVISKFKSKIFQKGLLISVCAKARQGIKEKMKMDIRIIFFVKNSISKTKSSFFLRVLTRSSSATRQSTKKWTRGFPPPDYSEFSFDKLVYYSIKSSEK